MISWLLIIVLIVLTIKHSSNRQGQCVTLALTEVKLHRTRSVVGWVTA